MRVPGPSLGPALGHAGRDFWFTDRTSMETLRKTTHVFKILILLLPSPPFSSADQLDLQGHEGSVVFFPPQFEDLTSP